MSKKNFSGLISRYLLWALTIFSMDEILNQRFGHSLKQLYLRDENSKNPFKGILGLRSKTNQHNLIKLKLH